MRCRLYLVISLILWLSNVFATPIKVAIVDNPLAKWTSDKYRVYYMQGLYLAQREAKKLGIDYEFKEFSYEEPAINILKAVKDIKKWQPDIVIGPCASEHFLLLKDQFRDVLVLSPYATATKVYELPKNFYTLAVSSNFSANKTVKYIQTFQPKRVFMFTDINCKACIDFADALKKQMNLLHIVNSDVDFIDSNLNLKQINYTNMFKNYKESSDLVVLNSTGYGAGVLMANISNTVKVPVTYIGGDSWGTYKDWDIAKINTVYSYRALRVTPEVMSLRNKNVRDFYKRYTRQYHEEPDAISYVVYNTLWSVTDSILKYNCGIVENPSNLLCSYEKAVKQNPQWHRPITHEVYQITKKNESFIQIIN